MKKETKILIVDDDQFTREITRFMLTEIGFTQENIVEASDGEEAWQLLEKGEKIDIIICDWNMPKMSGPELLERVRADERFKDIPFLMLTAYADKDKIMQAKEKRVTQYIVKPFTPEVLAKKLE
jgi:two-component system chemotaxis response regulator CheY